MDTIDIAINHLFKDERWHSFHDTVYESLDSSLPKEKLIELFFELPKNIQLIAYEWGLSDTVFNEAVYEFLKERKNGKNETTCN